MDPKRPWDCADMAQVRAEIDRIDHALVDLIAQRFGYVDRAWQLKKNTPEGATVPWRIQQVIDRVKGRATEKGLPPEMVEMVGAQWRNMIGWFVQYEEEKLRQGETRVELKAQSEPDLKAQSKPELKAQSKPVVKS